MIKAFLQDESGATAIEYGLIAGLVAVAIIAALTALGSSLSDLFSSCLLYTSPSPRDATLSRMPSSA